MIWSYQENGGNDTQLKLYNYRFCLWLHHFHVQKHMAFLLENLRAKSSCPFQIELNYLSNCMNFSILQSL